jgi:hydroxymethylbilane synthase
MKQQNTLTTLTIATRESRLALWQAEHVKACLEAAHPGLTVKLLGMTTEGDQRLDVSLAKIGGKGLFVKELEAALHDGRADLAVHSLKDVPAELPEGFALACVMEREDPRDAFISNRYASFAELPAGAVVGTSSLRREVQIRAKYPSLKIEPLRGNLDTRFRKLDEGQYDAIILAYAGVKRLGLAGRVKSIIERDEMLPAAAQGALGIEIRSDRTDVIAALAPLMHADTMKIITAERAVLLALGGSCTMPLAAHCTPSPNGWKLKVVYGRDDGSLVKAEDECEAKSNLGAMRALGERVAADVKAQGL